ncbi:MAG: DUF1364 domain-containing protein, partial [Nitrosomonadaceae bacterium]
CCVEPSLSKIRKSARDEDCQVRIPGVCNFNPETTILGHLGGAGMARKSNDIHSAYCCSDCHDVIDGRVKCLDFTNTEIKLMFYDGMVRTQLILIEKGLISSE